MRLLPTACLLTALALTTGVRADTLQVFSIQSSMADGYSTQGALSVDVTTGEVETSNFSISRGGIAVATFTDPSNTMFDGFYQASFVGSDPDYLYVVLFPQADLAGYAGGSLCSENMPCDGYASGSYVPSGWEPSVDAELSPVPEPPSLTLLTTGAVGVLTLFRRRPARRCPR